MRRVRGGGGGAMAAMKASVETHAAGREEKYDSAFSTATAGGLCSGANGSSAWSLGQRGSIYQHGAAMSGPPCTKKKRPTPQLAKGPSGNAASSASAAA